MEEPDLCRKMASKQVGMNPWGGQDEMISPVSRIKHLFSFFLGLLVQSWAMVCECLSNSVSANAPWGGLHG